LAELTSTNKDAALYKSNHSALRYKVVEGIAGEQEIMSFKLDPEKL
jgi:hypothetical protein